ncbi:MAG: phosphosulfolactate synthase, partial [Desulfobacterales bacterium]
MANDRDFNFSNKNERASKPRAIGVTEIRGPYYAVMGKRYLQDIMETMGDHVDLLKFSGGSFTLMPRNSVVEWIDIAHRYNTLVSTGGFMEYVLTQDKETVNKYIETCKDYGFDIIERSAGFITLPADDRVRLIGKVQEAGLKAKPKIGIQFGAGGNTRRGEL